MVLAALSVAALYATARTALAPRDPERGVAAVFAPWIAPETAFALTVEAGARFVRYGGPAFVTIAIPERKDYAARLFSSGAWLVVDPRIVAACLSTLGLSGTKP